MRPARLLLLFSFAIVAASPGIGQEPKADLKAAASKVVGVTVYQNTALVTREVTVPDAVGPVEVTVTPLPASTMSTSLYAEGADGVRVLSTRYRTRAISEDTRVEVRLLEAKVKENGRKLQAIQADAKALEANTAFLGKLEVFTAATLGTLTEKGQLDAEKTLQLVAFVRDTRTKAAKEEVALKQSMETLTEETEFTKRRLGEVAGGRSRTERDAIIVLEKTKAGPATIRLNYLVSNVTWRPLYKLRAGGKDKDPVTVDYLASVSQQTGEDWANVDVVLSTAQPLLNASPPDLRSLEVAVAGMPGASNPGFGGGGFGGQQGGFGGGQLGANPAGGPAAASVPPPGMPGGGGGGMPSATSYLKSLDDQSKANRSQSQALLNNRDVANGNLYANNAANLEQYRDLLATKEEVGKLATITDIDGPSVNYHLKTKLSLPSRSDDQVIEIAKLDLASRFYYKAVPLLTSNVYRIADLTNTTDMILLAGEATMYLGMDFVGQTRMPLVAIGKPFTLGFGVDPQLQVSRKLMDKTRTTQGGNQVLTFKYRILLTSYKAAAVDVQVVDRVPFAEASQTIAVMLLKGETDLSKDTLYVRDERPKNLLRWDVKVDPKQNGDKALSLDYEYKMEFEKSVNIGSILAR